MKEFIYMAIFLVTHIVTVVITGEAYGYELMTYIGSSMLFVAVLTTVQPITAIILTALCLLAIVDWDYHFKGK